MSAMKPWVTEHGPTDPPPGFMQFNALSKEENPRRVYDPAELPVTPENWQILRTVGAAVNASVRYRRHDEWRYPDANGYGDCKAIVLQKRRELVKAGISRATLSITAVLDREGQGHSVLMVRTTRGDYILDNQVEGLAHWSKTGLVFLKRQSFEHPIDWVALDPILVRAPQPADSP